MDTLKLAWFVQEIKARKPLHQHWLQGLNLMELFRVHKHPQLFIRVIPNSFYGYHHYLGQKKRKNTYVTLYFLSPGSFYNLHVHSILKQHSKLFLKMADLFLSFFNKNHILSVLVPYGCTEIYLELAERSTNKKRISPMGSRS